VKLLTVILIILAWPASLGAADWPQWGHDNSRNMVGNEKNLPDSFDPGKAKDGGDEIDLTTTKNVKWVAKLGSQTYGNPTVGGGRVFVAPKQSPHRGFRRADVFR